MDDVGQTILVVEDDRDISELIALYMHEHGFRTLRAFDQGDVDAVLASQIVDLIILDINLPAEDGYSICVRLRRTSRIPIIMLTAKGEDVDRILGLEIGADDYVTKPFNPRELLARVRAVLRRLDGRQEPAARTIAFDGWNIDLLCRRVRNAEGAEIALTSSEFELLLIFCEHSGRVLNRDRLLELTQGSAASGRSIDIVVSRLRRKMEDDPRDPTLIKTVRSGGYVFAAPVQTLC